MTWLTDPFALEFMQRALVAGILAAVTSAIVGTWVVLRGLTFLGDALAHGVLPGVALAVLWGVDPVLGAAVSVAVMVAGIDLVNRRSRLTNDTAIGLLFVGMLALGVVIISREGSVGGDLTAYLFGNILGVDGGDLALLAGTLGFVVALTAVLWRPFLVLCLDEQKAAVLGLRPRLAHVGMLTLLAASIVASFQAVGTLLVFGLLVGPPATASLVVRRVPAMMATGVALGVIAVVAGLLVSYHYDTAQGATMAGISVALFFATLAGRGVARGLSRR